MRGPCPLFPAGVVQPPVDRRADQRRILRDEIERDAAIPGPRNGIGSGLNQRRDRGAMAFKRGNMQRGNVILVPRVGIGPGPQAGAHILGAGRLEETPTVPVHAFGAAPARLIASDTPSGRAQ